MKYKGFNLSAEPMFPGFVPGICWAKDIYATPLWPRYFLLSRFRWDTPEEAMEVAKYYVDKCLARNRGDIAYLHNQFSTEN